MKRYSHAALSALSGLTPDDNAQHHPGGRRTSHLKR